MSNMTPISDYVLQIQTLEQREEIHIKKIRELEDEIINLKNNAKANKEMIEYLEETYKNFCINFDALINGENNGN